MNGCRPQTGARFLRMGVQMGKGETAMAHKVLYYTLDGNTAQAEALLEQMGMADDIALTGCPHAPFESPSAEQLSGCEGFIGEFAPVQGDAVDAMADAGVKIAASMSIGLNHMDVTALKKRGVTVSNCPGYCAEDVATHAVALMLDLMRRVTFQNRVVMDGVWDPKGCYEAYRTQGRTLGLVFFGRIAQAVVPVAKALGMRVLVWAPTKTAEELAAAGCDKASTIEDLLRASDVVSVHCPLIPETEGLIGECELALMKPTAYLVNTARGGVVDEDALLAALDANVASGGTHGIRAAGLDVLESETEPNEALIHHPRCLVTPHSAYDSREAYENLCRMTLEAVCDVLVRGVEPRYAV